MTRAVYVYENADGDLMTQLWSGRSDEAPQLIAVRREHVHDFALVVQRVAARIPAPTQGASH